MRKHVAQWLSDHEDWTITALEDGLEAVEKAAELRPSLVILDLSMPGMDGLSAARKIGEMLPATPILLFTLHNYAGLEEEAKKAKVLQVIRKMDVRALLGLAENSSLPTDVAQNREHTERLFNRGSHK